MEHIIPFGNHPLFRFLLGWMVPPKVSLLKLTETKSLKKLFREKFVFQDMLIPLNKLADVLSFLQDCVALYPIWICPHRVFNTGTYQGFLRPSSDSIKDFEMFVDVGAYGPPRKPFNHSVDMPKIEKKVRDTKGYQALYAYTYMTREEFRQMFNHNLYDSLRKRFSAEEAFPEVYDKISDRALEHRWARGNSVPNVTTLTAKPSQLFEKDGFLLNRAPRPIEHRWTADERDFCISEYLHLIFPRRPGKTSSETRTTFCIFPSLLWHFVSFCVQSHLKTRNVFCHCWKYLVGLFVLILWIVLLQPCII